MSEPMEPTAGDGDAEWDWDAQLPSQLQNYPNERMQIETALEECQLISDPSKRAGPALSTVTPVLSAHREIQDVFISRFRFWFFSIMDLTQEGDHDAVLHCFVSSWADLRKGVTCLRSARQLSAEYFDLADGGLLLPSIRTAYDDIVLHSIENSLLLAVSNVIRREKEGGVVDCAVTNATAIAFYESTCGQWNIYKNVWHKPLVLHISRVYCTSFQETWCDIAPSVLVAEMTRASDRIAKYCPNGAVFEMTKTTLLATVSLQAYSSLLEHLLHSDSFLQSIMFGTCSDDSKDTFCNRLTSKHMPLLGRGVVRYLIRSASTALTERFQLMDFLNVEGFKTAVKSVEGLILAVSAKDFLSPQYKTDFLIEKDLLLFRSKLTFKIARAVNIILENENSAVRSMFREGNEEERTLCTWGILSSSLLNSVEKDKAKTILETLFRAKEEWFSSNVLQTMNKSITDAFNLTNAQYRDKPLTICAKQKILKQVLNFYVAHVELEGLLKTEDACVTSILMSDSSEDQRKLYAESAKLNNFPSIEKVLLTHEAYHGPLRRGLWDLLEKSEGKWFSEGYLLKLEQYSLDGEEMLKDREYLDRRVCENIIYMCWSTQLHLAVTVKLALVFEDDNSEINGIFKRNSTPEILDMYKTCFHLEKLAEVGRQIFDLRNEYDERRLNDLIQTAVGDVWPRHGLLRTIDEHLVQRRSDRIAFFKVYYRRIPEHVETSMDIFESEFSLELTLEDDESFLSRTLTSGDETRIKEVYEEVIGLGSMEFIVRQLLQFELRPILARIASFVEENVTGWFTEGNLHNEIDAEVCRGNDLITYRCGDVPWQAQTEKILFVQHCDTTIAQSLRIKRDAFKREIKNLEVREIGKFFSLAAALQPTDMTSTGLMIINLRLQVEVEKILTDFFQNHVCVTSTIANNSLHPSLSPLQSKSLVETGELIELLRQTLSMYLDLAASHFPHVRYYSRQTAKDLAITVNNASVCGRPGVREIIATYMDAIMSDDTVGDKESHIEHALKVVPNSEAVGNFRKLSEKFLAKRLLRLIGNETKDAVNREKRLISRLKLHFDNSFVLNMEKILFDFTTRHCFHEGYKESMPADAGAERSSELGEKSTSVSVLCRDIWQVDKEDQLEVPHALGQELRKFKLSFCKERDNQYIEYAHSFGRVALVTKLFSYEGQGEVEMIGSVLQASILILFNFVEGLTFAEILESIRTESHIEDKGYLKRTRLLVSAAVTSLSTVELPLLLKKSESEKIDDSDLIHVNRGFSAREKELQLPTVQFSEGEQTKQADEIRKILQLCSLADAVRLGAVKVMKEKRFLRLKKLFYDVCTYLKSCGVSKDPEFTHFRSLVEQLVDRSDLFWEGEGNLDDPVVSFFDPLDRKEAIGHG